MAFTSKTQQKVAVASEESITMGNAAAVYTSEIDFLSPDLGKASKYVTLVVTVSGVLTTCEVNLYGAWTTGGTKFLLYDSPIADLSAAGTTAAVIDLNAYPAPYYYVGLVSAGNDSGETADVRFIYTA